MAVKHILKNGTVVDDMSKVVVPKEVVEAVARIAKRKGGVKNGSDEKI